MPSPRSTERELGGQNIPLPTDSNWNDGMWRKIMSSDIRESWGRVPAPFPERKSTKMKRLRFSLIQLHYSWKIKDFEHTFQLFQMYFCCKFDAHSETSVLPIIRKHYIQLHLEINNKQQPHQNGGFWKKWLIVLEHTPSLPTGNSFIVYKFLEPSKAGLAFPKASPAYFL